MSKDMRGSPRANLGVAANMFWTEKVLKIQVYARIRWDWSNMTQKFIQRSLEGWKVPASPHKSEGLFWCDISPHSHIIPIHTLWVFHAFSCFEIRRSSGHSQLANITLGPRPLPSSPVLEITTAFLGCTETKVSAVCSWSTGWFLQHKMIDPMFNGLVEGQIYRKPCFFTIKYRVSCKRLQSLNSMKCGMPINPIILSAWNRTSLQSIIRTCVYMLPYKYTSMCIYTLFTIYIYTYIYICT